jgi:hypothetical protein
MKTALRLAFDFGGILSFVSLSAFLGAGARLIRDGSDAGQSTGARAESPDSTEQTGWNMFLTF